MLGEVAHCLRVEQVGAVGESSDRAVFAFVLQQVEVELGGDEVDVELAQIPAFTQVWQRRIEAEQNLQDRIARRPAIGLQRAEQVTERHLVLESGEQRVADLADHAGKRRVAGKIDTDRYRVHEEAVHLLERPMPPTVGNAGQHDVVLSGVAVQEHEVPRPRTPGRACSHAREQHASSRLQLHRRRTRAPSRRTPCAGPAPDGRRASRPERCRRAARASRRDGTRAPRVSPSGAPDTRGVRVRRRRIRERRRTSRRRGRRTARTKSSRNNRSATPSKMMWCRTR